MYKLILMIMLTIYNSFTDHNIMHESSIPRAMLAIIIGS